MQRVGSAVITAVIVFVLVLGTASVAARTLTAAYEPEEPDERRFIVVEGTATTWNTVRWTFPQVTTSATVKTQQASEMASSGGGYNTGTAEFQVYLIIGNESHRLKSITLGATSGVLRGEVHGWMPKDGYAVEPGDVVKLDWRYRTEHGGAGRHNVVLDSPVLVVEEKQPALEPVPATGAAFAAAGLVFLAVLLPGRRARPGQGR
jgi:hypothetical protein